MRRHALVLAAVAAVVIALVAGAAPPPKQNPISQPVAQPGSAATAQLKPDLTVQKIWVESTQPDPSGGTQVTVKYTIYNNSSVVSWARPTAAGLKGWNNPSALNTFFCGVDMRELPNGVFLPALQGTWGTQLKALETQTFFGVVLVPHGKKVEIRATVDTLNWIDESDETNNSKSLVWPMLPLAPPVHK